MERIHHQLTVVRQDKQQCSLEWKKHFSFHEPETPEGWVYSQKGLKLLFKRFREEKKKKKTQTDIRNITSDATQASQKQ